MVYASSRFVLLFKYLHNFAESIAFKVNRLSKRKHVFVLAFAVRISSTISQNHKILHLMCWNVFKILIDMIK